VILTINELHLSLLEVHICIVVNHMGDSCATNNECSSKECDGNICRIRTGGPSDSESVYIMFSFIGPLSFIILLIIICWCCCYKKYKYNYLK